MQKKMNTAAKTIVGLSATIVILITSVLVMSACNKASNISSGGQATVSPTQGTNQSADNISADDAKNIVLSHSGVSAENAHLYKSELEREDGRMVYEIEFFSGEYEYDYEVDAATGEIMKFNKEYK